MSLLNPTPPDRMVDQQGRPYFLWDVDVTMAQFLELLNSSDTAVRAYWIGKTMRQAKPDDVLTFVRARDMESLWPSLEPYLGDKLEFWKWFLGQRRKVREHAPS